MNGVLLCDEDLLRRLPLPLAQLCRRAHNAKTPLERHQAAYYLWEASLKLLSSVAVVEYAELSDHDPQLEERLQNLARPSLGHWWEFLRRLAPILSAAGDGPFTAIRDLVLGKARDDLPRAAGLDASLDEALDGHGGVRAAVRVSELFDRLVRYRNREVGHGAAGQRSADFYDRMGRALLAGMDELLGRLDVLAGRRLLYVEDLRKQATGHWLVERAELIGENPRRIESLELAPQAEAARRLCPQQLYLEAPGGATGPALRSLHPLLIHDAEMEETLFLNARRGKQRIEYLGYNSGRTVDRAEWQGDQRALMARVLSLPVAEEQAERWAARSQAEEQAEAPVEPAAAPRRLGEFELLSELGRGGMGVVYRAWQPSLGRQVALKALFRTGDPKAEARFAREIHALGQVEHPHLVKIFTSGSDGDQWFYAMELVEGATLGAVCERLASRGAEAGSLDLPAWRGTLSTVCEEARQAEKPLSSIDREGLAPRRTAGAPAPPPVAPGGRSYVRHMVDLVRQAALAVHALHEHGVIHRDIKPGNVMVTEEGGQAVLMDLGLAQLADDVQGRLTKTRQFVGTLRYASPEQVDAVGRLDRRSDVYSLGATLWELLTLRPLFGATEETPTPEVIHRIQPHGCGTGAALQHGSVGGSPSGGAEMPGERRGPALRQRRRTGGGAGAGRGGRAGAGAAGGADGTGLALVPPQSGRGVLAGGGGAQPGGRDGDRHLFRRAGDGPSGGRGQRQARSAASQGEGGVVGLYRADRAGAARVAGRQRGSCPRIAGRLPVGPARLGTRLPLHPLLRQPAHLPRPRQHGQQRVL